MKIKKKDSVESFASIGANRGVNDELVDAPDRSAGILAATIIDVRLERLLAQFLIDDAKEVSALISAENPSAPLGTLSARARTAYCLGLISSDELHDINTIRQIRNIFAHHLFDCTFQEPQINLACENFRTLALLGNVAKMPTQVKFTCVVATLDTLLDQRTKRTEKRAFAIPFTPAQV